MSGESKNDLMKFIPFSSSVDPTFWHKLAQIKLDVDKLNEPEHQLWGYYSNIEPPSLNCVLNVDCSSFNDEAEQRSLLLKGTIINKNTVEAFKECDKVKLLQENGKKLWKVIETQALDKPYLLNQFFMLTFADLKKYHFYYWFAFPVLNQTVSFVKDYKHLSKEWNEVQIKTLSAIYVSLPLEEQSFFPVVLEKDDVCLKRFRDLHDNQENLDDVYWCFSDPSQDFDYPGWPLRNFLAFIIHYFPSRKNTTIKVISVKCNVRNTFSITEKSQLFSINVENVDPDGNWVGWERNERGKMGPRMTNLSQSMDPVKLSEASVDLNLKLMKWQIVPDLDLDIVKNTKCLLLGSGTLGCSVGRNLLSWGVRHVTFVDKGRVSYSNPVRQHLFKFKDSINGGRLKSEAAAEALTEIFPGVVSKGVTLSIPMPGHPVGESLLEDTKNSIAQLDSLIEEHDVIFLLMDSRESRWLPTVIATAKNKITINAALGFDSYLVMRHGVGNKDSVLPKLGCYFCNDVTAPGNSSASRTLDQQCTVTRPGVSNIAGALAVELMASILQHPLQGLAPASEEESCVLGRIPHSIRGFLEMYRTLLPTTEAFSACTACCDIVITEYLNNPMEFVIKVLNSKEYLEELTGLSKLHEDTENADIMFLSDSEEEGDDDNEEVCDQ